ncbi:MAG: helix-turn-helix transcriptional regulator [Clostridia bacterium]|nr:helix-turn-helix transcriptional regulator [Clostridia bacterium]
MVPKYSYLEQNGELSERPVQGLYSCIQYVSAGRVNALHYHASYSATLMLSGRIDFSHGSFSIYSDVPTAMLLMPFMPHSDHAWEDTEYRRYVLYAKPELMERFTPQIVDFERLAGANLVWAKPCPEALQRLKLLMQQFELLPGNDNNSAALLLPIFMQILLSEVDAGRGEIVKMPHPYISSVLRELAERMEAPPTIDDVCRRVGVGRSKLQRDFKAVTGMPWHRYLTAIRMKRAHELLLEGKSILHTSMACGYSTESHFIMAFRKFYGETPGEMIGQIKEMTGTLKE